MQLRTARLCLDCEEVHEAQQCPICASETFTFMTRWVPVSERRRRERPTTSPEAEAYRYVTNSEAGSSKGLPLLKQGLVALTAVGLAGWFWRNRANRSTNSPPAAEASQPATSRTDT